MRRWATIVALALTGVGTSAQAGYAQAPSRLVVSAGGGLGTADRSCGSCGNFPSASALALEAGLGVQISQGARLGLDGIRWRRGGFDQTLWAATLSLTGTWDRITIGAGAGFGYWDEARYFLDEPDVRVRWGAAARIVLGYEVPVGGHWAVGPRLSYMRTSISPHRYELWHAGLGLRWH